MFLNVINRSLVLGLLLIVFGMPIGSAHVNIITSMFMAEMSGSAVADAAVMSKVFVLTQAEWDVYVSNVTGDKIEKGKENTYANMPMLFSTLSTSKKTPESCSFLEGNSRQ